MNRLKQELQEELDSLFEVDVTLETPNDLDYGDYATAAALEEANKKDEPSKEYAEEIIDDFPLSKYPYVESIEVAGNGYINFNLDGTVLGAEILSQVSNLEFENKDQKIIIEHTSPNPNKPLHMGTMRCAMLGDAMARISKFLGYEVEIQNYINDLGRQSATSVYAYDNFKDTLDDEVYNKKADYWIGVLYSQAAQYINDNPDAEEDVQRIVQNIEEQGNDDFEMMTDIVEKSLRAQIETAHRSNVFYDIIPFESDVVNSGLFEKAMDLLESVDKIYEIEEGEDEGCTVIDMSDYEEELGELEKPYKVLLRSDGTATYTAKDIAFTLWKFGVIDDAFEFKEFGKRPDGKKYWRTGGDSVESFGDGDIVMNVIGRPQAFPMQVIESALKALGYESQAENFIHLDFKFVYLTGDALPEEASDEKVAYSGRKGNWKGKHGDAVLDRAVELATQEIEKRHPNKSQDEIEEVAEQVAVAAVRYFLLRFSKKKDIEFSFEKVMNWEGDSGPYLQYSSARAKNVVDGVDIEPKFETFNADVEIELLHEIDKFEQVIKESFEVRDPSKLTHYLRGLAETYNSFYQKCHVQRADTEELKRSRAALTYGFIEVLEQGMQLLGIEAVDEL